VTARDVDVFGDSNLIMQQIRGDSQCLDGVLNSYRDMCLDIIKLVDTFSIKHIPQEVSIANQLAQQASGYVVTQGGFWVTSVSLVENRYALRSKGKPMLEISDRLQDKGKLIPDKAHRLSGNSEPESGNIGKSQDKAKLTSGREGNEESVIKENEFEKVGSSLDEEKTKLIRVDELAKDGDMVQTYCRLPLMECIRDPGKITDKKIKRQVLK
jgi:hypothetical protein